MPLVGEIRASKEGVRFDRSPTRLALEISLIYALSGVLWAFVPEEVVRPQFVFVTFTLPSVALVFLLVKRLLEQIAKAENATEKAEVEVIARLARVAEWKDDTLGGHNQRIAYSSALVARQLGLSQTEQWQIFHGALLHDIGKIGIPDELLQKRSALEPSERDIMKSHVEVGAGLLEGSNDPLLQMAHTIALTHHERWDGTGYPSGLAGEEIPIAGRIVGVCDVFDALLSERYYKRAWTMEAALVYLRTHSGTHFDPVVVEALVEVLPALVAYSDMGQTKSSESDESAA